MFGTILAIAAIVLAVAAAAIGLATVLSNAGDDVENGDRFIFAA